MNAPLPKGWTETTLGDLIEPRRTKADPQATPTARFVGLEHVEAHTTKLLGTTSAATMKSTANAFKRGDVLYGRLRPYLNKVCQPDFDGLCSGEFVVMPENHAVSGAFLKFRLSAYDFVDFASHLNTGDRPRVDFGQLRPFPLALPPKSEQTRIADQLADLFEKLDAGSATLLSCQEKLARYRASVLKAAVEGDLTADWRKKHPDAEPASKLLQRILAERRRRWEQEQQRVYADKGKTLPKNWKANYEEPVAGGNSGLPTLPRGWCWTTLDQLAWSSSYGISIKCSAEDAGLAVLRIPNVADGVIELNDLKFAPADYTEPPDRLVAAGDMLVVRTNGSRDLIGRGAFVKHTPPLALSFASYLIRFRLVEAVRWLSVLWDSHLVRRWVSENCATSAGQYNISLRTLKKMPLPLPPFEEQNAIAAATDQLMAIFRQTASAVTSQLATVQRLRQSILHRAFTGNLLPQDPRDEPASELLERIARDRIRTLKHRT